MIQFVVLLLVLFVLAAIAIAFILAALVFVAMACMIGIPLWIMAKHWSGKRIKPTIQSPIERLRNLYLDGKIDLWEFERRVAKLVAAEH